MTDNTEEALIPPRFSVGVALSFLGGDKLSTALAVFVTTKVDCTHSVISNTPFSRSGFKV